MDNKTFENLDSMMNSTSADFISKLESIKQTINAPEAKLSSILEHIDTLTNRITPLGEYSPLSEDIMQTTLKVLDDEEIKCGCKGPVSYIVAYENTTDFNESGIYYSYDGYKWYKKILGYTFISLECVNDIVYGAVIHTAGANTSDTILTSIDGIRWTPNSSKVTLCHDIVYIDGNYVGITDTGMVSSANGIDWNRVYLPNGYPNGISSMVYQFSLIAVTKYGEIDIFMDKDMRWASLSPAYTEDPIKGLTKIRYLNHKFFAVGYDRIMVSGNGIDWETYMIDGLQGTDISFNGSVYIITCNNEYFYSSEDGITWTKVEPKLPITSLSSIIYANNMFMAAGNYNGTACFMTSYDGDTWTRDYISTESDIVKLEFAKNMIFVLGSSGAVYRSRYGTTWEKIPMPVINETSGIDIGIFVAHNKLFATRSDDIIMSMDGKSWLSCSHNEISVPFIEGMNKSTNILYLNNPSDNVINLIDGQTVTSLYTPKDILFKASVTCTNYLFPGESFKLHLAYHENAQFHLFGESFDHQYETVDMNTPINDAMAAVSVRDCIFILQKTIDGYNLNQYKFFFTYTSEGKTEWKNILVESVKLPLFNTNGKFLPLVYNEYADMIILPYLYDTADGDVYGELIWAYTRLSTEMKFSKSNITIPDIKSIKACDKSLLLLTPNGVKIWDNVFSLAKNAAIGTKILNPIEDEPLSGTLMDRPIFSMGTESNIVGTATIKLPFEADMVIVVCSIMTDTSIEKFVVVASANGVDIPYIIGDTTTSLLIGKDLYRLDPDNNRIEGDIIHITLPIQVTLDKVGSNIKWYAYKKS